MPQPPPDVSSTAHTALSSEKARPATLELHFPHKVTSYANVFSTLYMVLTTDSTLDKTLGTHSSVQAHLLAAGDNGS